MQVESNHHSKYPGQNTVYIVLLFEKISTGDPPLSTPGHPLNCHVGPATKTATTCFLKDNRTFTNNSKKKKLQSYS